MEKVLVFDFGASSARAMLCSAVDGRIITEEIYRFKNGPVTISGVLSWNIDYLLSEIRVAFRLGEHEGCTAVSIDTWGVDYGLIGADGRLITAPRHYRDERTVGMEEKVFRLISRESLYNRAGIQHMRLNTIFQLYADKENSPEMLGNAEAMLMMPDLFAYYLTGERRTEYTIATTTSLVNPATRDWDGELIDMLGFQRKIFMPIIEPGEIYGYIKPEFTSRKIPLIAAPSHDTAAAICAVPSLEDSFVYISLGTWALFGTELDKAIATEKAERLRLTNEGGYGGKTELLSNIMGTWLLQECLQAYSTKEAPLTFPELIEAAENSRDIGSRINPNDDVFSTPGDMPGRIRKYLQAKGATLPETMGELLRVVYESLSDAFANTLDAIRELTGKDYRSLYIFGGGSRDRLLCRLTAEKTKIDVYAGPVEATAAGNAAAVLIALGEIGSIRQAREMILNGGEVRRVETNI